MTMMAILLVTLSILLGLVTLASLTRSYRWWIRIWDFPRLAIALTTVVVLICGVMVLEAGARMAVVAICVPVLGWQIWRIFPYTIFHRTEVKFAVHLTSHDHDHCFTALTLNVLETNRDYARTIALIERIKPDILLLMETDTAWAEALAPALRVYEHRNFKPIDNTYGMMFATHLPVHKSTIEFLVEDGTPSVFVWLKTRGGRAFHFMGLHPRPPLPGEDTEERDAEIAIAAKRAEQEHLPVLAMGDFNDVAWSRSSRRFKRLGSYVDPRIGRGFYATFPANIPLIRWPLDHLFMTRDFTMLDMQVLENVGSDHLPVFANLCLNPIKGEILNDEPEAATDHDHEVAAEIIEDAEAKAYPSDGVNIVSRAAASIAG